MSRATAHKPPPPQRRAVTLIEMLVALAVVGVIFSSVAATFIMILNLSGEAEAQLQAAARARAALNTLALDLKSASGDFSVLDAPLSFGDGVDNDMDGFVDEEALDGLNDDGGPWQDRHALLVPGVYERSPGLGVEDPGDAGVDEDCRFQQDEVSFRVSSFSGPDPLVQYRLVSSYRGDRRVLLRAVDDGATSVTAPLARDVLSFSLLCWNDAPAPPAGLWKTEWTDPAQLPQSVLVEIVLRADAAPPEAWTPGEPVETVSARTLVNVEQALP